MLYKGVLDMKKSLLLIFLIVIAILFCGYYFFGMKSVDTSDIAFISLYSNYAWGKRENGYVILRDGRRFDFDFSNEEYKINFYDKICKDLSDGKLSFKIGNYGNLISIIDKNQNEVEQGDFSILSFNASMDRGSTGYYCVYNNHSILLFETGDWYRVPANEELREIAFEIADELKLGLREMYAENEEFFVDLDKDKNYE